MLKKMRNLVVGTLEASNMVLDTLCIQFTPHSYNSKDIFKSKETVLVKTHQLEIMHVEIGEEGPRLVPHPSIPVIPIRGRIVAVRAVRNGHLPLNNDSLLVTTESERLLLISCDKSCSLSVTEIDIHDPACRPIEAGLLIATNNSESRYSKHLKKTESINLRSSSRTINSTGYKKSTVIENHLLAVLHTVQGLLKIIHIDIVTGQLIQRNERIEELSVLDMVMLDDESICLLYETAEGGRAIRNYSINLTTIEPKPIFDDLEPDSYQILSAVDGGILVLGVGTIFYWSSLPGRHSAIATKSMKIACTSIIEDHSKNDIAQLKSESKDISSIQNIGSKNQNETFRILLADADGEIHLLVLIPTLNTQDGPVFRLQLQSLGYSICPSGISYVRDGLLIVSGRQKSYMLYQLSTDRLQNGTFLLPLSSYTSVKGDISNPSAFEGPIIDMATVPETASTCIASCVGFGSEGGLQITRKGALIEIDIELDFEMPILKLFLRPNMIFVVSPFTTSVLSVSFNSNNNKDRLERLQENLTPVPQSPIVEEIGLPNFVKDQQSIAVFLGNGSEIIQILPDSIIFTKTGKIWKPLRGSKILYASRPLDESSLFCIITSEKLLIFINADTREPYAYQILNGIPSAVTCHIRSNVLEVIFSSWETDHLVYITSDEHCTSDDPLSSRQCVEKPFMFEELAYEPHRFKLTHHITALSSLLFCEGSFYLDYLFAGFGDGSIVYFPINDPLKALHVKIGNCPVRFEKLSQPNGSQMLVSISDRAFVVDGSLASLRDGEDQISKFRVTFSMYNSRVPFSSFAGFLPKGLLIMASENRILLGRMSGVSQRLNHERVQFGSTIMRVVNLDSFGLYAILQRFKDHNLNGSVALIDHETLTEISHYAFKRNEQPTTIFNLGDNTSIAFAKSILLVGTCLLDDEDQSLEPKSGRILTFSIDKRTRSLSYLSQIAVGGAVYALQVCSTVGTNTRFLATVNGSTHVYRWDGATRGWILANEHHGNIIGVRLDVDLNNKLVAVGDLMRSVTLLAIPEEDGQEMKEMARDWGTHWITEVSMMPPGPDGAIAAIASDNIGNILLFERIVDPYFANSNGEKKWLMKATGGFHVGEIVNRIIPRTGALLGRHGSSSTNCNLDSQTLSIVKDGNPIQNSALVATANGSLLIIGEVSDVHYEIFQKISNAMEPQGYGGNNVSNCELRRPMTFKRNVLPSKDGEGRVFVDLDLVISFSNLTREKQHQVLQASESYLKLSEVLSLIEEIRTFNY